MQCDIIGEIAELLLPLLDAKRLYIYLCSINGLRNVIKKGLPKPSRHSVKLQDVHLHLHTYNLRYIIHLQEKSLQWCDFLFQKNLTKFLKKIVISFISYFMNPQQHKLRQGSREKWFQKRGLQIFSSVKYNVLRLIARTAARICPDHSSHLWRFMLQ